MKIKHALSAYLSNLSDIGITNTSVKSYIKHVK